MEECSMTEQEIQKLAADYAALLSEYAALKEEIALMQQQNDWMKKQLFGRKTEQTSVIMEGGTQLSMFSDEKENKSEKDEKAVTVAACHWCGPGNEPLCNNGNLPNGCR